MKKEKKIWGLYNIINKIIDFIHEKRIITYPILIIFLLVLPKTGINSYLVRVMTVVGIYIILSLSLNLISGYTGQISIGHAGFYAIGAYTSALLSLNFDFPFLLAMVSGGIVAGIFGLLLGLPTLRLSGTYLAVTTIGFCEVIRMILLNWEWLARGPLGLNKIPRPVFFGIKLTTFNGGYYYLIIVLVVITTFVMYRIVNSKLGRALVSIREDELAATLMGIKTTKYKVLAFTISSFFAGIAGSFYAHFMTYIDPNGFIFDESVLMLSIVILGGMGTLKGMFLGSALLVTLPELLRDLQEYRFVMYGVILVLMMRFRPQGVLGGQSKKPYQLPKGIGSNVTKEGEAI
ncbi:MAG: branched-chain amino acid ABC transporter permease [Clostridia bacterium]|nr:branched-chain amino acid ABC transporter permease [Clostridia bacterium]